jgi:general secretion pathway protein A
MYNAFFNLTRGPFEISPDPYFLYATEQHQEALAGLYYGVTARKGFMVLTGEVGTGKTLVVRCLQELLDRNHVAYSFVFNTRLSSQQFLEYVAEDLGISPRPVSRSDLLIQLNRLLIERHHRGLTTVLVVEEAQHLTPVVLEELRLLTNLETPQGKLLQIALVGQPELETTLESPALRQLKQRISLWFTLHLLSEDDTLAYVQLRLRLAGDGNSQIFTPMALERVYSYSQGIPRLINTLCDNALMSAFALRKKQVTPELVDEAALDLHLEPVNGNGHRTAPLVPGSPAADVEWEAGSLATLFPRREPGGHDVTDTDIDPRAKEGHQ